MRVVVCTLVLLLVVGVSFTVRADESAVLAKGATAKFMNFPGLPTCAKGSVANGDPTKGPSVLLVKTAAGCQIPWHWHTATEQLMVISGSAKVEMKDGAPASLRTGDYISLPSKHAHQFTCAAACTFFVNSDTTFDIHYVDASGKEISPDEALKSKAKNSMKKAAPKNDMKDMKM